MASTVSEGDVRRSAKPGGARAIWLKIHRWLGLALAVFLVSAGLTGSLLAFHDILDAKLNPHLYFVQPQGERLSPLQIRARAEELLPKARVDWVDLDDGPTDATVLRLKPRIDPATGEPYERIADQMFMNPYTGEILGQRDNDVMALDREHAMETLFMLHRYLLLGDAGTRILVFVACSWFISVLIGFYLTLPPKGRRFFPGWKPSWRVQWKAPLPRFAFDLHRATGLWLWIMLFTISFGAVRVTLGDLNLFDRILGKLTPMVSPEPTLARAAQKIDEPKLTWDNALALSRTLMEAVAQREGFKIEGETRLGLNRNNGTYVYVVRSKLDVFDSGETELYVSAIDGREIAFSHPQMTWGNSFSNWTFALHRARVGGVPYKIFVSLTGLATAALAITGFIVWLKRRRPSRGS